MTIPPTNPFPKPPDGPAPWKHCGLTNPYCEEEGRCVGHSTAPTNPDAEELEQAKRILVDIAKRKGLYQEDFTSFIVTPEELAAALSRYIQKERQKAVEDFVAFLDEWPLAEPLLGSPRQHVHARAKDYFTHQKESLEKEK